MTDSTFDPEVSDTLEEAYAKSRARTHTFANGVTVTNGELEDMDADSRLAFLANMAASPNQEDVE